MAVRRRLAAALALSVLSAVGCTSGDTAPAPKQADPARSPATATGQPPPPTAAVTATPPPEPHPVSLPAMFDADYDGRDEQHAFGPRWAESIEHTSEFFADHL